MAAFEQAADRFDRFADDSADRPPTVPPTTERGPATSLTTPSTVCPTPAAADGAGGTARRRADPGDDFVDARAHPRGGFAGRAGRAGDRFRDVRQLRAGAATAAGRAGAGIRAGVAGLLLRDRRCRRRWRAPPARLLAPAPCRETEVPPALRCRRPVAPPPAPGPAVAAVDVRRRPNRRGGRRPGGRSRPRRCCRRRRRPGPRAASPWPPGRRPAGRRRRSPRRSERSPRLRLRDRCEPGGSSLSSYRPPIPRVPGETRPRILNIWISWIALDGASVAYR